MRLLALMTVGIATLAGSVSALGARTVPPWGPEAPPFNVEIVLRDVAGGAGFGHVKFRQPNDPETTVYLDTWVRGLAPNHSYRLQRAVDAINNIDGTCDSTSWLTLGRGPALPPQPITTDEAGTGRELLWRTLPSLPGSRFDIHFRVIDAATSEPVLESACYEFAVSR
jgi:hypothetical protein